MNKQEGTDKELKVNKYWSKKINLYQFIYSLTFNMNTC